MPVGHLRKLRNVLHFSLSCFTTQTGRNEMIFGSDHEGWMTCRTLSVNGMRYLNKKAQIVPFSKCYILIMTNCLYGFRRHDKRISHIHGILLKFHGYSRYHHHDIHIDCNTNNRDIAGNIRYLHRRSAHVYILH